MIVPKYIEKSIYQLAKANSIANKCDAEIRDWLKKNNLLNDTILDRLIDSCDTGYSPDDFVEFLKTEAEDYKGNNNNYE